MQLSFQYGNATISFEVIYRSRKTMAIRVEPPERVIVIVPKGTKKGLILKKVHEKAAWITAKLESCKNIEFLKPEHLDNGSSITYRGEKHLLYIEVDAARKNTIIQILDRRIILKSPDSEHEHIKEALEARFRQEAREAIEERIRFYQPAIGRIPNRVFIKAQRSRWGSCSSLGNLNFNWKIILLPPAVFDYIVVHEMCHLVYLNHSSEFWNLLASVLPDYRESYQWLRNNSQSQIW